MKVSERYKWEAETSGGQIITSGGDLKGCVRFSLIPQRSDLPRHDIVGVVFRRRFCRGFIQKNMANKSASRFYFHCVETGSCRIWVDYLTGGVMVTPRNYEHYI